jgi:hypothetical protein
MATSEHLKLATFGFQHRKAGPESFRLWNTSTMASALDTWTSAASGTPGLLEPSRERENRTRELEEPASGPSRRPALEAPQPQTGGGSARERENGTRGREEPASDPT